VKYVEELRQRIVYEWEHIDQHIDTAIRQWHKRLQACVQLKEDSSSMHVTFCQYI